MTFIKKLASYFGENVTHRAVSLVGLGTPYFQIIPFLVNFLNLKDIYSILHGTWFWCSKSKNPDNLCCHRQELTLVAETLAQETIIVLKNSSVLIEIKALSLFFFHFEKKKKNSSSNFEFFPSPLPCMSHDVCHKFTFLWLCNSFSGILVQVLNSTAQLILELLIKIPILVTSGFVNRK